MWNEVEFTTKKVCRRCGKSVHLDGYNNKARPDGKQDVCRPCDRLTSKENYKKNIHVGRRKRYEWQERNRELHNQHAKHYRDRKREERQQEKTL